MTFAAKIKTLEEDKKLFKKFCESTIPLDFYIFRIMTGNFLTEQDEQIFEELNLQKRVLISSIPGYSTHCESDLLSPLENWGAY